MDSRQYRSSMAAAILVPFATMFLVGAAAPTAGSNDWLLGVLANPVVAMVAVHLITAGVKKLPKMPSATWIAALLSLLAGIANAIATGNTGGLDPQSIWAFVQNSLIAFGGSTGIYHLIARFFPRKAVPAPVAAKK